MLTCFNGGGFGGGGFGGGFGDGGYSAHERCNDYYEYKETSGGGSGGGGNHNKGGGGLPDWGLGWLVIIIVGVVLLYFIAIDAGWAAIDTLLGLGFLAFLFARS